MSTPDEAEVEAWNEGWDAYVSRVPNPYDAAALRDAWDDGWNAHANAVHDSEKAQKYGPWFEED